MCLVGPEYIFEDIDSLALRQNDGKDGSAIFVTGSSTLKRQGAGGFKEIDDVSIAKPLVKYSIQI